jgi:hypothetical protein
MALVFFLLDLSGTKALDSVSLAIVVFRSTDKVVSTINGYRFPKSLQVVLRLSQIAQLWK